ncbi:MAG: zinc-dependent peptidase [Anaerolineae bacterium]|jgi:hypothetical protein|nr:zinc-dependent peptidase [Anaerolineae bacterium]
MQWLKQVFSGDSASTQPMVLDWETVRNQEVSWGGGRQVLVGERPLHGRPLTIDGFCENIPVSTLTQALSWYGGIHPLERSVRPQLAALLYDITHNPRAMAAYFPITKILDEAGLADFHERVTGLIASENFALRVWRVNHTLITDTAPPSLAYIVAGHIIEVLFYRLDIQARFFSQPRAFDIYLTQQAYEDDGGVAGGCYDPRTHSIKLVAKRLYEGFYDKTPGVSTMLHELGHMLDALNPTTGDMEMLRGLLPGLSDTDGALYTPEARQLFLAGRQLEIERYQRVISARASDKDIPIGHPYVFSNNYEFIAGHLEMFFRNPHYFAAMNPNLYDGFAALLRQDPRQYWAEDFAYYIRENRTVYLFNRHTITPLGLNALS